MHIGTQAQSHNFYVIVRHERELFAGLCVAQCGQRVGWYSVGAVVSQCVFGSFSISVYHRHGKLLCLWRLYKLRPVRTSSAPVS